MPYIKKDARKVASECPLNAGELNFAITKILLNYLTHRKESYSTYNEILGALEGAKLELYRRKIASYEDLKIQENGDVY